MMESCDGCSRLVEMPSKLHYRLGVAVAFAGRGYLMNGNRPCEAVHDMVSMIQESDILNRRAVDGRGLELDSEGCSLAT
jgi:hypothetical protein